MDEHRVEGLAAQATGKVESGVGRLTGDHELQAKGAARDYAGQNREFVGRAKDAASDMIGSISESGGASLLDGAAYARRSVDMMRKMVEDHPIGSLALAAAVGSLFALALQGRR